VQMPIHIHPRICFHYFLMPVVFVVDDMLPQVSLAVQIDELNVKCNKKTVLLLRKLAVENKVCMYVCKDSLKVFNHLIHCMNSVI